MAGKHTVIKKIICIFTALLTAAMITMPDALAFDEKDELERVRKNITKLVCPVLKEEETEIKTRLLHMTEGIIEFTMSLIYSIFHDPFKEVKKIYENI